MASSTFITGLLTGDFGLVWDGIKDIFRGGVNIIIGVLQLLLFRGIGGVFRGLIGIIRVLAVVFSMPSRTWVEIKRSTSSR